MYVRFMGRQHVQCNPRLSLFRKLMDFHDGLTACSGVTCLTQESPHKTLVSSRLSQLHPREASNIKPILMYRMYLVLHIAFVFILNIYDVYICFKMVDSELHASAWKELDST